MTGTSIILIRHGETTWNAAHKMQGHEDAPLNERGEQQAAAAAAGLRAYLARPGAAADDLEGITAVYASDLSRAYNTAKAVVGSAPLEIVKDAGLRERHLGKFQTHTLAEVRQKFPQDYQRHCSLDPDWEIPGGGESVAQFYSRVRDAVTRIAQAHVGKRILIVTHGGVLGMISKFVLGTPLEKARRVSIVNCAINEIGHVGSFANKNPDEDNEAGGETKTLTAPPRNGWVVQTWGLTSHLSELGFIKM